MLKIENLINLFLFPEILGNLRLFLHGEDDSGSRYQRATGFDIKT